MQFDRIDGHTFCPDLLNGGWVIDAGCRGFAFTDEMSLMYLEKVYAIDIEDFGPQDREDVIFKHAALTHFNGEIDAYYFGNGTANFLKGINETPGNTEDRPCETKKVKCITLKDIYEEIGTDIDLIKLDIEGAEYEILAEMEPIPKQISVEFHDHVHPKKHHEWIGKVLLNLEKNYKMLKFSDPQWPLYDLDVLFIRKDML